MFHHDQRDYNTAASEAAKVGRQKMEEIIHKGQANAQATVGKILARQITDSVVKTDAVKIEPAAGDFRLILPSGQAALHRHAWGQLVADAGMPKRYADELEQQANGTAWGAELVAHNVNTILAHRHKQRNLIRAEGGTVKGWLSDKFRRLDSRPLLDAFMGEAAGCGLVPIDGISSDTKARVRAVLPQVFEPVPNEVMLFGVEWGNSDYGDGGHCLSLWVMRVWCTNLAIGDRLLRQIHLGARLNENIAYSQRTYELDTRTNASALKDVVRDAISPNRVNGMLAAIKEANDKELIGKDGVDSILKKHFDKADAEAIKGLYEGPDVQNLPPGKTVWRLSNAVSFFAQADNLSPDRRLELQAAAGALIPHKAQEALAV